MLPYSDVFITLRNDRPSMDERDQHWCMILHEDGCKHVKIEDDTTSEDCKTFKPPK
jgi:hypothetical protein